MSCNLSSTGLDGSELIYLDYNNNIIIPTSNEIQFSVNDITLVKIDSTGLLVYNSTGALIGWWNVQAILKDLINKYTALSTLVYSENNKTIIASPNEIQFLINNETLVKIDSTGLLVYNSSGDLIGWWNIKDKIKDLINKYIALSTLIYMDINNDTIITATNEIKFKFGNILPVKITNEGLFIDVDSEWWNVKDKIKGIIDTYGQLDARMIVFETQLIALKSEMYAAQIQIGYHSVTLLLQGLSLTSHGNSINGINDSIFGLNVEVNEIKNTINNLTNPSILNVNNLNVSQTSTLNGDTTLISSLNVSGVSFFSNDVTMSSKFKVYGDSSLYRTRAYSLDVDHNLNVGGYLSLGTNTSDSILSVVCDTLGDGGTNNGSNSCVFIKQLHTWGANQQWALYVNGYTYLDGLRVNGQGDARNIYKYSGDLDIASATGAIKFTQSDATERMRVNTDGNIGIGTAAPGKRLHVAGTTQIDNDITVCGVLFVSSNSILKNSTSILSSLNISGATTINGSTSLLTSLNVGGNGTLSSLTVSGNGILASLNVGGNGTLSSLTVSGNGTLSSLNVGGNGTLNSLNVDSSLNVSGVATFNNTTIINGNITCSSRLNVVGRTSIGNNTTEFTDAIFEVHNNINVRKNVLNSQGVNIGDQVYISAGTGLSKCSLRLEDGFDANITSLKGVVGLNATNTIASNNLRVNNNLEVGGKIITYSDTYTQIYVSGRAPITFTTNRTVTINSKSYSAYDVDLNKYTNFLTLDGRKIRQFRLRSWHSTTDFESINESEFTYQIFMSDLNVLSIRAYVSPFQNYHLDQLNGITPTFYKNSFDKLTYLSPSTLGASVKVYCIFEDLL